MKKNYLKTNSGSVLVGAMALVLGAAAFLYCYLYIVQNSTQSTARAQRWNSALAVAESGIEEGLANLNSTVSIATSSNAALINPIPLTHSLTIGANGNYNGIYNGSYSVGDFTNGGNNTLTSTGSVTAPVIGDTIRRVVQVTAKKLDLFSKGIISATGIDMSGNKGITDSYDSRLGAYINEPHFAHGDVSALNGNVNLLNHTINGNLNLGSDARLSSSSNQITGAINTGWNISLPDAQLPTNDVAGIPLPQGIWPAAPGVASHTFTKSGFYSITDQGNITVASNVTVILDYQPTTLNLKTTTITINGSASTTNSGTLIIYQESGTMTDGGGNNDGAVNGQPINFQYFGLRGVTAINMNGSGSFTGTIYAPEADMTLNGGGDIYGTFIVHSWTDKGHYDVHYDQALIGFYFGYYTVSSWQELPPPAN